MIMTPYNRRNRTETCHSATSSIINLTWAGPRINSGLRGEEPATNRLSHGTDLARPMESVRPCSVETLLGARPDLSLNCIFSLGAPTLTAGRVYRVIRHRRCRFTYSHTYLHILHIQNYVQCTLYAPSRTTNDFALLRYNVNSRTLDRSRCKPPYISVVFSPVQTARC